MKNSLGFHQAVNRQQSNQAGEKTHIRHVVRAGGFLQLVNLNRVRK